MLTTQGTLRVEPHKGRIIVELSKDFINYYNWFITKRYWIRFARPLYGAHITVANSKFHNSVNWQKALHYNGKKISIDYDEYIIRGGQSKGYDVFYVKVHSDELENLKKKFGIRERDNYLGLHITIANSKGELPSYWPEMIEIRKDAKDHLHFKGRVGSRKILSSGTAHQKSQRSSMLRR